MSFTGVELFQKEKTWQPTSSQSQQTTQPQSPSLNQFELNSRSTLCFIYCAGNLLS